MSSFTIIDRNSFLWSYLLPEIRDLIEDGEYLFDFVEKNKDAVGIADYSFLVFPFSKAYEGFLKKLFLDLKLIKHDEYYGDDIRIGRILNPIYQKELGNTFALICSHSPAHRNIAEKLWDVWKHGRNLVFHFFPHNFRRLSFDEALELIRDIVGAMELAVLGCELPAKQLQRSEITSIR